MLAQISLAPSVPNSLCSPLLAASLPLRTRYSSTCSSKLSARSLVFMANPRSQVARTVPLACSLLPMPHASQALGRDSHDRAFDEHAHLLRWHTPRIPHIHSP